MQSPKLSLVIPGLNEAETLTELAQKIDSVLTSKFDYEIIFVDDGSTDNSWEVICQLAAADPKIRGLQMRSNFGKAMALAAGFDVAKGDYLFMMDADLQDDPQDLPLFIEALDQGNDVVVGWKQNRQDPLNRLIFSKIFNGVVGKLTKVKLHDMNCGFKAYRREVIEIVPIYGDLFRFIPVLAAAEGFKIVEVPIRHHPRAVGTSRYGLERIFRGFFDLLSVVFITRYAKKPMHLFGLLGLICCALGVSTLAYLSYRWTLGYGIGSRPLLTLGTLLTIVGLQFVSLGFIGEFLTYQHQKGQYVQKYPIRRRIEPS